MEAGNRSSCFLSDVAGGTRALDESCTSALRIEFIPLQAPSPAGPPVIQFIAWLALGSRSLSSYTQAMNGVICVSRAECTERHTPDTVFGRL